MLQVSGQNFQADVLSSKLPVIVDFWAAWCMPCRMLAPIFEKVSKDFAGRMVFAKCDVDANQALAEQYDIRGIPCMIIFKDGKEKDRLVGALSESILREKIGAALR